MSEISVPGNFYSGLAASLVLYLIARLWLNRRRNVEEEQTKMDELMIDGGTKENFMQVFKAFRKNFHDGYEQEGAAFAVYYQGEKVVDLWGGWKDKSAGARWTKDTLVPITTASRAAIACSFATMVDRKYLRYDDYICKYWRQFGHNEKNGAKVRTILDDTIGIPCAAKEIQRKHIQDHKRMGKLLEDQVCQWKPGTQLAYSLVTGGFLADQLCRKVDKKGRNIARLFHEEISVPYDVHVYLQLPKQLQCNMARLSWATNWSYVKYFTNIFNWGTGNEFLNLAMQKGTTFFMKSLENMEMGRLYMKSVLVFNNPEWSQVCVPSLSGCATADGLAKMMSKLIDGTLCSDNQLKHIAKPKFQNIDDQTLMIKSSRGHGFVYTKSKLGNWQLGFPAYGGSNVKADMKHKLTFAYVTNGMKIGIGERVAAFKRLEEAVYRSL